MELTHVPWSGTPDSRRVRVPARHFEGNRGFAAIEADIDTFVEEAFALPLPGGVRGLGGFERRLAIAAALGVVPGPYVAAFKTLARVRHDFAHGNITELSEERARQLREAFRDITPEDVFATLEGTDPHYSLVFALVVTRLIVQKAAELSRERRQEIQRLREGDAIQRALRTRVEELTAAADFYADPEPGQDPHDKA
jgi:hypothetical protein